MSKISRLATFAGSSVTEVSNATPAPMPMTKAPAMRKFVTGLFPPLGSPPPGPPKGPPPRGGAPAVSAQPSRGGA